MSNRTVVGTAPRPHEGEPAVSAVHDELGRHLARCRHAGTRAALLVARIDDQSNLASDELEQLLRVRARSLRISRGELLLLCDAPPPRSRALPLNRRAIELRVRHLTKGRLLCGWAAFPADGVTLADLVARARRASVAIPESYSPGATPMTVGR